ncbi:MAG: AMP-binding protein [Myxococcota bacterium]|nr:AMP-binding protein [Myxococcota bacterium]
MNLYDIFRERFPTDRSLPFHEIAAGELSGSRVSYADVETQTARLANRLARLGARPGDRVAAQIEKSPEAVLLYLACLRGGFVYLPLNPAYRRDEVAYFLVDAEPAVYACAPERVGEVDAGTAQVVTLDAAGGGSLLDGLESEAAECASFGCDGDTPAAILYTSGTTGRSKGAVLSHANLAANARALHAAWGFAADDVLLHALPVFHAHGLFVALNTTLLNGTSIQFLPRFDPRDVLRCLPKSTVMMGVPTHYTRLLAEAEFSAEQCASMRLFVSGSAPLLAATFEEFRERTGHTLLERYGMTETGMNTSNPLDGERVAGSVGLPLPGVECRICDADGRAVDPGEVGGLEVRGPNVFREYWRMPEKTASEFREGGWFITGDLARIDERGYVHLVGRAKDLVISGGLNVFPKEVEGVIDDCPGVLESAVFGLPDADFGEAVCAAVVAESDESPEPEAVIAFVKERLAGFKAPKRVFVVADLPRNAMGKVQKNRLREEHGE